MTRVKCLSCMKILESKHGDTFQRCSCPNETTLHGTAEHPRIDGYDFEKIAVWRDDWGAWVVLRGAYGGDE